MKTHHIFYTIFISLFTVGLGILAIFAFFPNILKPRDVDLTGKTFIYDNINVEWADGLTETEKETLLEGSTEEEYFAGVKLLMGSSLNGYSIEFTSKTSLTIIADQNEDVCPYVVSGNTITITSPEGESQSFIYDDSNLIMNLPENELTLMLSVKITIICIDSEVVPPAESGVDLTGKKYIYNDITIHGWVDGLTQEEKNALLNDQTQQEYFDGLEWGYSIGMFNSNSSIEFIDANNAVVVAPITFGSNSYKYLADETTVVINYQMGMQLSGVYDEESLVINLDDVDNGVNVSFLFVKDDGTTQPEPSTPPADSGLDLTGKTFVYDNMLIDWVDGITETQKTEFLQGATEIEYFISLRMMLALDNSTGLDFIDGENVNMLSSYDTDGIQAEYTVNDNVITITDSTGESQSYTYEDSTLAMQLQQMMGMNISELMGVNIIYTFIEGEIKTPSTPITPATGELDLTGKSFVYADIRVGWEDGITSTEKTAILNSIGATEQEYLTAIESMFTLTENDKFVFVDSENVKLVSDDGEETYTYLADQDCITIIDEYGETQTYIYENDSIIMEMPKEIVSKLGVSVACLFVEDETVSPAPPADGELNLVGKTFAYSGNMDVEWAEGVTEGQKESMLNGETEEDFFNKIKGYYSDNLDGVTVYILDNATIRMSDAYMEEVYSYVINGNTMTLTDEYGDSLIAIYENNTLIIISTRFGLDDLNLIYTFIENA